MASKPPPGPLMIQPDLRVTDAAELEAVIDAALAKGCAVVPLVAPARPPCSCPAPGSLPAGALLSVADLTEVFHVPPRDFDRMRKRLERFRTEDCKGWVQVANPQVHEPRIFYRIGSVWPIMLALLQEIQEEQTREP
jgi:hypothetical protein